MNLNCLCYLSGTHIRPFSLDQFRGAHFAHATALNIASIYASMPRCFFFVSKCAALTKRNKRTVEEVKGVCHCTLRIPENAGKTL